MEEELYNVPMFHDEHGEHSAAISVREVGDDYCLFCRIPVLGELLTATEPDCFAALQGIRRRAEGIGWKICVYGAHENVWPSGMSRSMGGGQKAYELELGVPERVDSLVDIFTPSSLLNYCLVSQQEEFAKKWFASLGG